jgi:CcmD family protein
MDGIRRRAWSVFVTFGWLAVAGATAIFAQAPAQNEYKPVSPGDLALEQLPATPLVFAAYSIVWVVLITYVFLLWQRLRRVEQEMTSLRARLDQPRR